MSDRLEAAIRELAAALREEIAAAKSPAPDRLLSIDEAAAALGIGRSALYSEVIAKGLLRSFQVGRRRLVPQSAIEAYIARRQAS